MCAVASEPQRPERPWPHFLKQASGYLIVAKLILDSYGMSVELFLKLLLMLVSHDVQNAVAAEQARQTRQLPDQYLAS